MTSILSPTLTLSLSLLVLPPSGALPIGGATLPTVWTVDDDGPADFALLQDAIDAASDGDVLLILPGTYAPRPGFPPAPTVLAGKSLHLVAELGPRPLLEGLVVRDLALGGTVTLQGLDFDGPLQAEDNAGVLWTEDCRFATSNFSGAVHPLDIVDSAAVHVNRSRSDAGSQILVRPAGMSAVGSLVSLYDSDLNGADGYGAIADGGDGAELSGGSLFASGSTLSGGGSGCGGDGLHLESGAPQATGLETTYLTGSAADCQSGLPAVPVRIDSGAHQTLGGDACSLSIDSPVRALATTNVRISGTPGDVVVLAYGASTTGSHLAQLRGVLQVDLASARTRTLGVIPAGGTLSRSVRAPAPPGDGQIFFLQALCITSGAGATLTGGSAVLVLP